MKNTILFYCRQHINKFYNMSDTEIYEWMCNNFYYNNYEEIRKCSFIIFNESRNVY